MGRSMLSKLQVSIFSDPARGAEADDSLFLMNRYLESKRPMPNMRGKVISLVESELNELGMIYDREDRFENEGTTFEIPTEVVDENDVKEMFVTYVQRYCDPNEVAMSLSKDRLLALEAKCEREAEKRVQEKYERVKEKERESEKRLQDEYKKVKEKE